MSIILEDWTKIELYLAFTIFTGVLNSPAGRGPNFSSIAVPVNQNHKVSVQLPIKTNNRKLQTLITSK